MTTNNMGGRALAIAAGVVFASGTAGILFEDVLLHGAAFGLKHYLTIVTLVGTMLAGHLSKEAWSTRHIGACVGFGIVFLAGTTLVVYSSLGRQAANTMQTAAEAEDAADQRARIKPLLKKAEGMLSETMDKIQEDCVNGKKGKGHCDGLRTTRDVYEAAVKGHAAELEKLGPPKPVAADTEQFATYAEVFGFDRAKAKVAAALVVPFALTLFCEFGSIWSFGYGFRASVRTLRPKWEAPSTKDTAQSSFPTSNGDGGTSVVSFPNRPKSGPPNSPNRRMTRAEIRTDLMVRNATGRGFDSQKDAAEFYGYSESRFSELSKAWEESGEVPKRRMIGRTKRFVSA